MAKLEKVEAMVKFKRIQTLKKCVVYFIAALLCCSVLTFMKFVGFAFNWSWFCKNWKVLILILNITIVTLATNSRLLTSQPDDRSELHDFYDELVKKNRRRSGFRPTKGDEKTPTEEMKFVIHSEEGVEKSLQTNVSDRGDEVEDKISAGQLIVWSAGDVGEEMEPKYVAMTDEEFMTRADNLIARIRSQIRKGV